MTVFVLMVNPHPDRDDGCEFDSIYTTREEAERMGMEYVNSYNYALRDYKSYREDCEFYEMTPCSYEEYVMDSPYFDVQEIEVIGS